MENCPTLPLFTPRHNIPPHCHLSSIFFLWNTRTEKTYRIRVEGVTLSYACAASGTVSIVPRHRQRRRPQGCIPDVAVGLTKRPGLPFLPSRSSACHGNNVLSARKAVRGLALALEGQGRNQEAIVQWRVYLQKLPRGDYADEARAHLRQLTASP